MSGRTRRAPCGTAPAGFRSGRAFGGGALALRGPVRPSASPSGWRLDRRAISAFIRGDPLSSGTGGKLGCGASAVSGPKPSALTRDKPGQPISPRRIPALPRFGGAPFGRHLFGKIHPSRADTPPFRNSRTSLTALGSKSIPFRVTVFPGPTPDRPVASIIPLSQAGRRTPRPGGACVPLPAFPARRRIGGDFSYARASGRGRPFTALQIRELPFLLCPYPHTRHIQGAPPGIWRLGRWLGAEGSDALPGNGSGTPNPSPRMKPAGA
jgi:hypothetical protein